MKSNASWDFLSCGVDVLYAGEFVTHVYERRDLEGFLCIRITHNGRVVGVWTSEDPLFGRREARQLAGELVRALADGGERGR